jgi:hypothetical protein
MVKRVAKAGQILPGRSGFEAEALVPEGIQRRGAAADAMMQESSSKSPRRSRDACSTSLRCGSSAPQHQAGIKCVQFA